MKIKGNLAKLPMEISSWIYAKFITIEKNKPILAALFTKSSKKDVAEICLVATHMASVLQTELSIKSKNH